MATATTTKKTITATTTVDATEKPETDLRITEQADEIAELKAQIALLMNMQKVSAQTAPVEPAPKKKKNVTIINLFAGGLTVKGNSYYHFDKQFDKRAFSEAEATAIVNNMPNAAREGIFYITDAQFVEDNDLSDAYENMIDDVKMRTILSLDANSVLVLYKNANDAQKAIIENMIVKGRLNGEALDANILVELGKITGKNYMEIEKMDKEG
uniref:Uncharacterized protein n=1 Tax=Siphoviridae sp. ctBCr48 TaxID=2827802 RepID=A0A8S5SHE3_9CAUD|nr:MAG TPA: hypothetical protein [Siphoviridae sp. ctBCr48]